MKHVKKKAKERRVANHDGGDIYGNHVSATHESATKNKQQKCC
jgi:hypothetical protein